jgi:hypothetical protein
MQRLWFGDPIPARGSIRWEARMVAGHIIP